ncbi:uncharacterized protein LOC108319095 [Vigna angularis]|uniref:uncharacterized protein LOC108319095 n=1 Tax=Phaseolus angularis TaxID=3914 RepID=UPI00080A4C4B|nr:uncharacterized protein LOC108319095 [Vigna angularis]
MTYRAKAIASDHVDGSFKEQYKRIYDYANELLTRNPGSTVKVPIIGLDGAFLKGKYSGELLTAVGRDANDQMLPLAYAIVEVENKDTWKWFLELLVEDVGGEPVRGIQQCFGAYKVKANHNHVEGDSPLLALKLFEVRHVSQAGDKKWAISGIPCCHALAAMKFLNLDAEDFIPVCFRKSTYEEMYSSIVYPINGENMWQITPYNDVFPPKKRILPRRLKKKIRLQEWELVRDDTRMRNGGIHKRCDICRELGHNKTSCQKSTQDRDVNSDQTQQSNPTNEPNIPSSNDPEA